MLNNYRITIDLFFLLMIFEGAIRKWLLPELGVPIQILRDILPFVALLQCVNRERTGLPLGVLHPYLHGLFFFYLLWSVLEMINPLLPDPIIGLLGIRTHFAYAPLIILMPHYINTWHMFVDRVTWLLLIAVPICTLAVYQTTQPFDSPINQYASGEISKEGFGAADNMLVRATGTFSYITGMGVFAQFVVLLSLLMLSVSNLSRFRRGLAVIAMFAGISGCVATGARSAILIVVTQIVIFILFQGGFRRSASVLGKFMVAGAISALAIAYFVSSQITAFMERAGNVSGDVSGRIYTALFGWVDVLLDYPLGAGLGAAHQQTLALAGGQAGFTIAEEELSRIAFELGIPGFFIFILFRLFILFGIWQKLRKVANSDLKMVMVFSLVTLMPLSINSIYAPIANALYWGAIGLAIWAYRENTFQFQRLQIIGRLLSTQIIH